MNGVPDLWEIMRICENEALTLSWMIEEQLIYDHRTGEGKLLCKNGQQMKLVIIRSKGLLWQCSKRNCCNRSRKTIRKDSFFYNYKVPINSIVMVIYLFIAKCHQTQIEAMTKLNRKTIEDIITGIYDLMEADLTQEDVQIGKNNDIIHVLTINFRRLQSRWIKN